MTIEGEFTSIEIFMQQISSPAKLLHTQTSHIDTLPCAKYELHIYLGQIVTYFL